MDLNAHQQYGNQRRKVLVDQFETHLKKQVSNAKKQNSQWFKPNLSSDASYHKSINLYRNKIKDILGLPLNQVPSVRCLKMTLGEMVGDSSQAQFQWVRFKTTLGIDLQGILGIPHQWDQRSLVILQHGGEGTPEFILGTQGETYNYHNLSTRCLNQGIAVFAPQLLIGWKDISGSCPDQILFDMKLKHTGGSLASVHVALLKAVIDFLPKQMKLKNLSIGMAGASYGGFYTLLTAALEPKIRAAYSSIFFNDRFRYAWGDWTWFGSGTKFDDVTLAKMIAPRWLGIEIANQDELFKSDGVSKLAKNIASHYQSLRSSNHFYFNIFHGTHEIDAQSKNFDLFLLQIKK